MSRLSLLFTLLFLFSGTTEAQVTVDTTIDGDDEECLVDCTIRVAGAKPTIFDKQERRVSRDSELRFDARMRPVREVRWQRGLEVWAK